MKRSMTPIKIWPSLDMIPRIRTLQREIRLAKRSMTTVIAARKLATLSAKACR